MRNVAILIATTWLAALMGCTSLPEVNGSTAQASVEQIIGFSFSATYDKTLVLSGHVPNEDSATYLEELAASLFPDAKVTNQLLPNSESVSGWARNTRWGLSSLSRLDKGQLKVKDRSVHLEGITSKISVKNSIEAATIGLKAEISHTIVISVAG